MRSPTSALALVILAGLGLSLRAATPLETWPQQVPPVDKSTLQSRLDAVDTAANGLPAALGPAVRFQKIFLRILSGEAPSAWRDEIGKFASVANQSPLDAGLGEVSRAWLARAEMQEIDKALRDYYRNNVRFPATLEEVGTVDAEHPRQDPWGDAWFYQPHAPQGFAKLVSQRYQLGPARFPQLGDLDAATRQRNPPGQPWQITLRDVAGNKLLEFHSKNANASVAIIQPGGKVDDCTLLFIGEGWALMAGVDQLFAVTF